MSDQNPSNFDPFQPQTPTPAPKKKNSHPVLAAFSILGVFNHPCAGDFHLLPAVFGAYPKCHLWQPGLTGKRAGNSPSGGCGSYCD